MSRDISSEHTNSHVPNVRKSFRPTQVLETMADDAAAKRQSPVLVLVVCCRCCTGQPFVSSTTATSSIVSKSRKTKESEWASRDKTMS